MHIPDGFIGPGVSVVAGVTALGGFGVALRRARTYLSDRLVPMAALVAAFLFAAQLMNFPVAPGVSGHLLGGVLAAVLVGPWAGYIVLTIVLVVQAFMADGGLTALGLNIVNIALIGAVCGYLVYRALLRISGSRSSSVPLAAGIAGFLSVPMAAMGFVIEYWLGGTLESVSVPALMWAMLGTHLLIGIGEGVITFIVVSAVMRARPDLVYGSPRFTGSRSEELVA